MFTLATGQTINGVAGSASAVNFTLTGDEKSTTDAFKILLQGQLPSAAASLGGPTGANSWLVQQVFFRNVTASPVAVVLFLNGNTSANQIIGFQLEANGSASLDSDGLHNYDSTGKLLFVGSTGATGTTGLTGSAGTNGWSPILAVVSNGSGGFVFQIVGWTGGTGSPPSSTNQFIGSAGIVGTAAAAQDVRGAAGAPGSSTNSFTTITGNSGSATADTSSDSLAITGTGGIVTTVTDNPEVVSIALSNAAANTVRGEFTGTAATPQDMALAANQFAARSSAGNITAKSITDAGLAWVSQANLTAMTATLDTATTSAKGLMSAIDKKRMITLQYSLEADFGGVGDDATLNDTAFATAYSTMPVGSLLNIGAGTFRVSTAIDINVDKRIQHQGTGRYNTIIKTTSATAHIFTKSVAGWYDSWSDLGFQSTVTRTAGAAINIPIGNNIGMNVYRCWMTGMFHGINATGAQSANLSVWSDLDISAVTNGGRGLVINGSTINVQIHNTTINAGSATTSACVEINQSGAVQVTNFDWIQGTNVILINSTAGAGPQACYFTNGFCDQPQGSVIKIIGGNTAGRISFTQVGIAPTGNNFGVEVAGTGAGGVGTTTALPAGIKLVGCDIYSSNGTNTGAGVRINGCQDVTIQNCNISGFNGVGGAAVYITPSAGNQTKVRVNGNIFGPNSNLTINNEAGVKIDAGASALGFLSITDNSMIGCTTAITDNSTVLSTVSKNINNNQGAVAGVSAQLTSAAGISLTTTEQVILQIPLPANSLKVGTTFRFTLGGICTTATHTTRVRIGTLGTIADAALVGAGPTGVPAAGGLMITGQTQVTAVGASGAHSGAISHQMNITLSATTPTQSGNFATTSPLFVSVCALASAAGPVIRSGTLEIISPS